MTLGVTTAGVQAQVTPSPRAGAAPIPVEVNVGSSYTSAVLVLSKPLAPGSRWGVFHENTLRAFYTSAEKGDVAAQTQLTYGPSMHFRLTAGAFYGSAPGVSPTAGVQFLRPGRRLFLLVAPRVNIESDPTYSVFSILRYTGGREGRPRLYLALQALNAFDARRHIRSYQWTRIGADVRGTQFGLSLNLDQSGPNPRVESSVGVFVRREVF